MRTFLFKTFLLALLFALSAAGIIGFKVCRFNRDDLTENGPVVKPSDRILFVGSSSIGCAITPQTDDCVSVFWRWKLQPQYFLFELEKLEREGALKNLKTVVVEFGFQNFAYQTIDDMTASRVETLPLAFGNLSRLPLSPTSMLLSVFDCIRLGYRIRVTSRPDPGTSIVDRSAEWQKERLDELARCYFETVATSELMCDGWQEALKTTYTEIFALCRRNKLRPIVLLTPMPKVFRDMTPPEMVTLHNDFTAAFKKMGFDVIDGRAVLDDSAFMDMTHLSLAGSKWFTEWFLKKEGE